MFVINRRNRDSLKDIAWAQDLSAARDGAFELGVSAWAGLLWADAGVKESDADHRHAVVLRTHDARTTLTLETTADGDIKVRIWSNAVRSAFCGGSCR